MGFKVNATIIKSSYFGKYRVPAGQTVYVEAAENDKLKIGVVYYIPDDFVLISFTYEAPNTNIQTGDIITISPTEKYYVITGAYGQSGSTAGVLFCARFV